MNLVDPDFYRTLFQKNIAIAPPPLPPSVGPILSRVMLVMIRVYCLPYDKWALFQHR